MKNAFTLIELLIVILMVAILAAIAAPMYRNFIEKARAPEAVGTIGAIRAAEILHKFQTGSYSSDTAELGIIVPTSGDATYWIYSISDISETGFSITATRTSKRAGLNVAGQTITLTWDDYGTESWSGTHIGTPE